MGVSTVAAYLTFGEQLVRIMICSEQSHWSPMYVWAEGLQLIGIRVAIALTLFIEVNTEGGSQGGRDQRPWGEGTRRGGGWQTDTGQMISFLPHFLRLFILLYRA